MIICSVCFKRFDPYTNVSHHNQSVVSCVYTYFDPYPLIYNFLITHNNTVPCFLPVDFLWLSWMSGKVIRSSLIVLEGYQILLSIPNPNPNHKNQDANPYSNPQSNTLPLKTTADKQTDKTERTFRQIRTHTLWTTRLQELITLAVQTALNQMSQTTINHRTEIIKIYQPYT